MSKMDRFQDRTHVSLAFRFAILSGTLLIIAAIALVVLSSTVVSADAQIPPHLDTSSMTRVFTRTPMPTTESRNFDAPWPTSTPYPATNDSWEEPTRWPTNTPRPTRVDPHVTNTPWPTNTPPPEKNNYGGNGGDWSGANPSPTPPPTDDSPGWVTNTPVPEPTATPILSYAMAFWYIDHDATAASGSVWRTEIIVRVPTSYRYEFDVDNLVRSVRTQENVDGDDIYTLYLSGMRCNEGIQDELEVYQEGLLMLVSNEFTGQDEPVSLTYNCRS